MKEEIISYLTEHPYYLLFVLLNGFIIYKVVIKVIRENRDDSSDEDDDDGGVELTDPDLDLPPGISLPTSPELVND